MRLTSKSEYGLLAVIDLAISRSEGPVSARVIAKRRSVPLNFLEQILHSLRKEGIIDSIRGSKGGFVLARDAETLTVLDVVEAVDGKLSATVCDVSSDGDEGGICAMSHCCAAASVWRNVTDVLRAELQKTRIIDLARDQKKLDQLQSDK